MTVQRPELRAALADLMKAVLGDLSRHDGKPVLGPMPDSRHWRRFSQTSFVALQRSAWDMPQRVSTPGWLDTFPEMAEVRASIDTDPVIATRVDTMFGTEFSKNFRRLDWLLIEHLLEPLVRDGGAFRCDDAIFDPHYARLEDGLLAAEIRMVEFVPLNAFISDVEEIPLAAGLVLRPMTDLQLSAAIRVQGVPGSFGSGPTAFEVSWLNQWALHAEQSFPVRSYKQPQSGHPAPPPFPALQGPAASLVEALRVVCGGSVVETRPIYVQHDQDLPAALGSTAILSPVGVVDLDRPTRLHGGQEVDDLREVFRLLNAPVVQDDRALRTALRRFVISGSRSRAEDRLIDLMISAEALFITRAGIKSRDKGRLIAEGASEVLAAEDGSSSVVDRMRRAYSLRNAEIHGDGTPTDELPAVVADVERVMRRALHLVLAKTG
jgi:hypothetical protein